MCEQRGHVMSAHPSSAHLATFRELAESGRLSPVIDRTYPLAEVPAAISYLEGEYARHGVARQDEAERGPNAPGVGWQRRLDGHTGESGHQMGEHLRVAHRHVGRVPIPHLAADR
jgi:hypothetical protein